VNAPDWNTPASIARRNRQAAERARARGDHRRASEHDNVATQLEAITSRSYR
jgi:hypothetical protein